MHIDKIKIKNFRILRDSTLDMKKDLSLLIGRNNSGKTSFLVLFEKFYNNLSFNYNDFSLCLRDDIKDVNHETNQSNLTIQMIVNIEYNDTDNLENLSSFILDLDDSCTTVNILFEASIDKAKLIKDMVKVKPDNKERFVNKNLTKYISTKVYIFEKDEDLLEVNRHKLIPKNLQEIKNIINFQIIHAKRNVSSSEVNSGKTNILSGMATKYFNEKNKDNDFTGINEQMIEMDKELNKTYDKNFASFMENAKEFLSLSDLKVVSNLVSNEIVQYSSNVVYGSDNKYLPEHLNGLGYMNILYLLLNIEMIKENFKNDKKDISLLFIEEPEAHTHPQMQYIFAKKIEIILKDIQNLQTIVTTHSAHIVSQCNFKDIRYLLKNEDGTNVTIKNFHSELKEVYSKKEEFRFIEQYLTMQSSELFFASKIIFIEGTTEKILLPYFIDIIDKENVSTPDYISLTSQNISIMEVGANAKIFDEFLKFLDIKTLIITDVDTTKKVITTTTGKSKTTYNACKVQEGEFTSNATIKHFLDSPEISSTDWTKWFKQLKNDTLPSANSNIKISYQTEENSYQGRSFEDAFLNINLDLIKSKRDNLDGLKNKDELDTNTDIYLLTENILDKKSHFASSLLYLALSDDDLTWKVPQYIRDGLKWIAK